MKWEKLGNVFDESMLPSCAVTHAQTPTPIVIDDKIVRVYFSSRDKNGKSFGLFADYDINDLTKVINVHEKPIISAGEPGTFDDEGAMPSYAMYKDNKMFLYYSGWNQKVRTPYHNSTGLAVSDDGENFKRLYDGPIMDRTKEEPHLAVTPFIIKEEGIYKMWYISGVKWEMVNEKYEPVYTIKYAESNNAIDWKRYSEVSVKHHSSDEVYSRPSVIKMDGKYHIFFCYRKIKNYRDNPENSYRIGYAVSSDGKKWDRNDSLAGIERSNEGWDSKMTCYPYVINIKGKYYMYYNGNGFGQSGFGLALMK